MRKYLISLSLVFLLTGCSLGAEGILVAVTAAGGIVSSMTASPDYAKYAEQCKAIIREASAAQASENTVLAKLAEQDDTRQSVLLYMAMRPKDNGIQRCALAMPKGFLTQLAESGNILNFAATVYGVNRDSANTKRALEANKELALAQQEVLRDMKQMEYAFQSQLASGAVPIINATSSAIKSGSVQSAGE